MLLVPSFGQKVFCLIPFVGTVKSLNYAFGKTFVTYKSRSGKSSHIHTGASVCVKFDLMLDPKVFILFV